MVKKKTSFALTLEAKRILKALSEKLGISQTAVLELAIREKGKTEEIKITK